MAKDRFLIGPYTSGLETSVRPWIIADDAEIICIVSASPDTLGGSVGMRQRHRPG